MDTYLVKYINNTGRRKQFKKKFASKRSIDQFLYKKAVEGCKSIKLTKLEPVRTCEYNKSIEKEILLKKKEYFDTCCIYALIDKDEVVYIGQSRDIMSRLSTHRLSSKMFTHFAIVERVVIDGSDHVPSSYLDERELFYIKALRPKYNKAGNKD